MKNHSRPKTIHNLWPEIVKAVNKGQRWNLTQGAIKARFYRGDETITKYHTAALRQRKLEQQKIYAAQEKNRMEMKSVLKGMESIRKKNDYSEAI